MNLSVYSACDSVPVINSDVCDLKIENEDSVDQWLFIIIIISG